MPQLELTDKQHQAITKHTDKANSLCEEDRFEEAIAEFQKALTLIPQPITDWEATMYVMVGIGDCHFLMKRYKESLASFQIAVQCPEGLGNYFVHLRLGESHFEMGNFEKAKDELARAFMAEGREAFADEDEKYFKFLSQYLR